MTSSTPESAPDGEQPDVEAPREQHRDSAPGPVDDSTGAIPDEPDRAEGDTGNTESDAAEPPAPPTDGTLEPTDDGVERRFVDPTTVRRAPRFGRFILLGIVLGALLSLALVLFSEPSQLARSDLFWLLFLSLGTFGGLLGAVVAVILDRRSVRRRGPRGSTAGAAPTSED